MLAYDFCKVYVFKRGEFSLVSGLISIVLPISGRESATTYGLCFLPCLFLTELFVYAVIRLYLKRKSLGFVTLCMIYLFCSVLYELTGIASVASVLPFSISFLLFEFFLKDIKKYLSSQKILVCAAALIGLIIVVGLNYGMCQYSFDLSSMTLGI